MNVFNLMFVTSKQRTVLINLTLQFHRTSCTDRWYKHYFKAEKVIFPPKNPYVTTYDWEHEPYTPKNPTRYTDTINYVKSFNSLNDECKAMFTYSYMDKKTELNEQINDKLKELGFHPTDSSNAARIVRMTMHLRYKKLLLDHTPRSIPLQASVRCLIKTRWRALRFLRSTNLAEFQRIQSALSITGFRYQDPFDLPPDPLHERKRAARNACYQIRLGKLANLKASLMASEKSFEAKKRAQLSQLLDDLATLVPSESEGSKRKEAEKLMRQLFTEVVNERKVEALALPQKDLLRWYTDEAKQREEYLAVQMKKQQKQLRRMRK